MKPLGKKNYGSMPHLLGSKLGKTDRYVHDGQNKILTEKTRDEHDFIIVTEKYDGSNVGIAKKDGKIIALTRSGYLADTSPYKQHHYFSKWVDKQKDRFDFIAEGERIVGEWMLQAHGIKYNILGDPFVAFDYFNAKNERLTYFDMLCAIRSSRVMIPNILHAEYKAISLADSISILESEPCEVFATENPEGFVYRVERKGKFDFMAKYVMPNHNTGQYIINVDEDNLVWNINPEDL